MPEASRLLPNIATLFELVDELAPAAHGLLPLRAIRLVNTLASRNSPTVRTWMKASSLFETRDAML